MDQLTIGVHKRHIFNKWHHSLQRFVPSRSIDSSSVRTSQCSEIKCFLPRLSNPRVGSPRRNLVSRCSKRFPIGRFGASEPRSPCLCYSEPLSKQGCHRIYWLNDGSLFLISGSCNRIRGIPACCDHTGGYHV